MVLERDDGDGEHPDVIIRALQLGWRYGQIGEELLAHGLEQRKQPRLRNIAEPSFEALGYFFRVHLVSKMQDIESKGGCFEQGKLVVAHFGE